MLCLQLVYFALAICFLQIRPANCACVIYGKEYVAEEYAFLCKNNITIPEKRIQEILALGQSAEFDPVRDSQLAEEILADLMSPFREELADIYLQKYTCKNDICHPHLLQERKPNIPENIPRRLEIHSIDLIDHLSLAEEITDLSFMPAPNGGIYLVVAYRRSTFFTLLRFNQDKLEKVSDFMGYSGNCLAASTSSWVSPIVLVTTCEQYHFITDVPDVPFHHELQSRFETTAMYVFRGTNSGLEFTEAIEIKSPEVIAVQIYFDVGLPSILAVDRDGEGHQYVWNDYEFDQSESTPLPAATHVITFKIALGSFLVLSNFLPMTGFEPKGAHVYHNLKHNSQQFRLYQRLGNCLASSSEHFTVSDLHFVAVTCRDRDLIYIYWWNENQFLLWQTIPTTKAAFVTAVRLVNWEIVLVVVEYPRDRPVIRFFQYEDHFFWPSDQQIVLERRARHYRLKIVSFHYESDTILVVNGRRTEYQIAETHFAPQPLTLKPLTVHHDLPTQHLPEIAPDFSHLIHDDDYSSHKILSVFKINLKSRAVELTDIPEQVGLNACLTELEKLLVLEQDRVNMLDVPLWDAVMTDRKQTITGEKVLLEGLHSEVVNVETLSFEPTVTLLPDDSYHCLDCEEKERIVIDKLSDLYKEAEDLVLTIKPEVVVGKIVMRKITIKDELHTRDVFTSPVCNINLNDLAKTSVYKTGDQYINITEMHTHFTTNNIDIIGLVNGVNLHNVASRHGSRHFTAPQTFSRVNVINVELEGKLNDIRPRDIVVNDLPQKIYGEKKIIGNLIIEGHIEIKNFNKVDFAEFIKKIMTTDTEQIIFEDVVFDALNVKQIQTGTLKRRNLENFYHEVLTTVGPQIVHGITTFLSDVSVSHSMNVTQINDVRFPSELLTTNTFQHIYRPVIINGKLTIHGSLFVDLTVNDIDWPYDVVTIYGGQSIIGKKTFHQKKLTVSGSISMSRGGLINSVRLSELGYPVGILHRNLHIEDLRVDFINGQSISNLLSVLNLSGRQNIAAKFTFADVEMDDIHVRGLIINHTLEYDFITLDTEQVIDEEIVFERRVNIISLELKDGIRINEKDLAKIHSVAVRTDGNHVIWGHKTFKKDVTIKGDVIFEPAIKLNDVDLSEQLFLTNKKQFVFGHFSINEIKVNNIIISGQMNTKHINRINVDEFFDTVVYDQGEFIIRDVKNFHSNVTVNNQLNVHLINDFDVTEFDKKILKLSTKQNIIGHLIFRDTLYLNSQSYVRNVNRRLLQLEESKLANLRNNRVQTAIKFQDCVKFKKNINIEMLNGINLEQFYLTVLSKSRQQNFTYSRTIIDNVNIDNLVVSKLDEILIKDIILTKEINAIRAPIVFHQKLDISSDVFIGTVNGIELNELQKETIIKSENVVLYGRKTFKQLEVQEVIVDKFINSINITALPNRMLQTNKRQTIYGSVRFTKGLSVNKLDSRVPINGIDLLNMKRIAVTKNTDQLIIDRKKCIAKIHHNIRVHNNLEITGSITHVNLIHGLNLEVVQRDSLIDGRKQTIIAPIIFRNDVTFNEVVIVAGTTNDLKFPKDVVKVNDYQRIRGTVILTTTEVTNIHVTVVNSINLTHLIDNRLTLSTVQTIHKPLIFEERVTVMTDLIIKRKFNHLTCSGIVTLDGKQQIEGMKTFVAISTVNIDTDFVNNFHWLALYNRIDQTTRRDWVHYEHIEFTNRIILKGPWESDLIAVKDIFAMKVEAKQLVANTITEITNFNQWLNASSQCVGEALPQIKNLVHYFDYLRPVVRFEPSLDIIALPFRDELHLLLVVDPSTRSSRMRCFNGKMYSCSNITNPKSCYPRVHSETKKILEDVPIQMTRKIDVIYGKNVSFLFIWNNDSQCIPKRDGVHLLGFTRNHLFMIDSFKEVDSFSILPGYPYSLFAVASHSTGVINVNHIRCDNGRCSLEPILSQIPLNDAKPLKLEWFLYRKQFHLLVITKVDTATGAKQAASFIYHWIREELVMKHTFFTIAPADATAFNIFDTTYLAVGSYDCFSRLDSDRLRIYQLSSQEVKTIQEIPFSTKSLSIQQYLDETYLAAASQVGNIFIYRWQGFFGFQLWSKILISKPQHVKWYFDTKYMTLHMTVAGNGKDNNSLLVTGKLSGPRFRKIKVP